MDSRAQLTSVVAERVEELDPHLPAWDGLAVERERPYCAPAWLLSWWEHAAPAGAELRVVLVLDGTRLVGVAPFHVVRRRGRPARYAMLGAALSAGVEPLAAPGREEEVAAVLARALAAADPVPGSLAFDGLPTGSSWPEALGRAWPGRGRPQVHRATRVPVPMVTLDEPGFDAWMAGRSKSFRKQMRQSRRKLEQAGAVFRTTRDGQEVAAALPDLERLHHARWDARGGSDALRPRVVDMLGAAGRTLGERGRLRLDSIEVEGRCISAHLFLSAGRETSYWLGGFDDEWAAQQPAMVSLVSAVEQGFDRRDARLDLGPGGQFYKYRFADAEECVEWLTLIPPGPHRWRSRVGLLPQRARTAVGRRLSPEAKARLRGLLPGKPVARRPQATG